MNPRILLLDEATSALDAESEYLVQDAMDSLMKGRAVLVIAHRLSTVKSAGTVAVVSDGQIVERGTHDELLSRNCIYFFFSETIIVFIENLFNYTLSGSKDPQLQN